MKDVAQTIASQAYDGRPKAILAGILILIVLFSFAWWKERVKK